MQRCFSKSSQCASWNSAIRASQVETTCAVKPQCQSPLCEAIAECDCLWDAQWTETFDLGSPAWKVQRDVVTLLLCAVTLIFLHRSSGSQAYIHVPYNWARTPASCCSWDVIFNMLSLGATVKTAPRNIFLTNFSVKSQYTCDPLLGSCKINFCFPLLMQYSGLWTLVRPSLQWLWQRFFSFLRVFLGYGKNFELTTLLPCDELIRM